MSNSETAISQFKQWMSLDRFIFFSLFISLIPFKVKYLYGINVTASYGQT